MSSRNTWPSCLVTVDGRQDVWQTQSERLAKWLKVYSSGIGGIVLLNLNDTGLGLALVIYSSRYYFRSAIPAATNAKPTARSKPLRYPASPGQWGQMHRKINKTPRSQIYTPLPSRSTGLPRVACSPLAGEAGPLCATTWQTHPQMQALPFCITHRTSFPLSFVL